MNDVTQHKVIVHRGFEYLAQEPIAGPYGEQVPAWERVGSADMDGNLSYEFNEVRVFKHALHGGLLIAQDSGCSCPSPFESAVVDDGKFLDTLADFDAFVAEHEVTTTKWNEDYSASTQERSPSVVDQVAALRKEVEPLIAAQPRMIVEAPSGLIEG